MLLEEETIDGKTNLGGDHLISAQPPSLLTHTFCNYYAIQVSVLPNSDINYVRVRRVRVKVLALE